MTDAALMQSLAEADRRRALAAMDPEDIDISDLDPAESEDWDDDQWERAFRSGLADTMEDDDDEGDYEDGDEDEDERETGDDEGSWRGVRDGLRHVSTSSTSRSGRVAP